MPRDSGPTRICANCGEPFAATYEYSTFKRKYCSLRCDAEAKSKRAVARYPPREEVVRLYETEGLSDVELGRRFGHSYQWAFKLRRHYGIAGADIAQKLRKPLRKKSDRLRWGIHLKREPVCRNCQRAPDAIRPLNLHHAIPRSLAPSIKYDLRNGIPLCGTCHMGWHHREVVIYREAFTAEEWEFLWNLEFQGFKVRPWLDDRYPPRNPQEVS